MKSLFGRFFIAISSVTLISFIIFGTMFLALSNGYVVREKEASLHRNSAEISKMMTILLENYSPPLERAFLSYLEIFSQASDADIIVVNAQGQIIYSIRRNQQRRIIEPPPLRDTVMTVLEENGVYRSIGRLGGLYENNVYTVGTPVSASDGSMLGGVLLTLAVPLNNFMYEISRFFFMAVLALLLICFIASYAISRQLVSPLRKMSRAAKEFAIGNFDVRIPVYGVDEVAQLAMGFNHMAQSLSTLEQSRSDFIANVSHDLRTPMTVIAGFVDGILDGTIEPSDQSKYLTIVSEEIGRLSRMVRNLLEIARIDAQEAALNLSDFDMCEMIGKILISFESTVAKKDVTVNVQFPSRGIAVRADYDSIFQVVYNLCDNAVKFVNDGGEIDIVAVESMGRARVFLKNTGEGLCDDELSRIFERFYKSDKSRGLDRKGTGLGLYIAKTIINRHGMDLAVRSTLGEYTEFSFELPLAQ